MRKNNNIICQQKLYLKVTYQSHSPEGMQIDHFLFSASKYLCLKGYEFIKKCYEHYMMIVHETNLDKTVSFFNLEGKKD